MAYDKLIDSAALDANLTSIADAIRAKAGTSDKLAFPAGFAEAIAAIEAGGGSAGVSFGKFKIATYPGTGNYEIAHGLGEIPYYFAFMASKNPFKNEHKGIYYLSAVHQPTYYYAAQGVLLHTDIYTASDIIELSVTDKQITTMVGITCDNNSISLNSETYFFSNAVDYCWIAMTKSAFGQ